MANCLKILVAFLLLSCNRTVSTVLDGSKSTNATVYIWRQISGSSVKINTPLNVKSPVTFGTKGIYMFELSVNGGSKDTVKITVQ